MGKKYIIELEDRPWATCDDDKLWMAKGCQLALFSEDDLARLTPYVGDGRPVPVIEMKQVFPRRLTMAIEEKGISYTTLARMVNSTETTIRGYTAGIKTPKGPIIALLARALDVSADYLLGVVDK